MMAAQQKLELDRHFDSSDCTLADVEKLDDMLVASRLSEHRRLAVLLLIHSADGAKQVRALSELPWTAGPGQFIGQIDTCFNILRPWNRVP
jgi:hypothetical protein